MNHPVLNTLKSAAKRAPHSARARKLRSSSIGAVMAIALSMLFASAPASAGDRGHGYRSGHGDFRSAVRHGYRDNYRHRGYRNDYRHHNSYYRSHRRHSNNDAAYLIGGLVLGSVITHAVTNRYDSPRRYNTYSNREVVYVNQPQTVRTYSTSAPAVQGRRLYRDLDGNCFERLNDAAGNELLQELPEGACEW